MLHFIPDRKKSALRCFYARFYARIKHAVINVALLYGILYERPTVVNTGIAMFSMKENLDTYILQYITLVPIDVLWWVLDI